MYAEKLIKEYLNKLASKSPAPGGGSAAALVGAIGVACLTKTLSFTVGNEKYKEVEAEMKRIMDEAKKIRHNFEALCSEDAVAYTKLSGAFKLPKDEERTAKIQVALKEAMNVPFAICKNAHRAIKLCPLVRARGNKNLISDVDCALSMLKCAYKTGLLNVEINLKSIKNTKLVDDTRKMLKTMEREVK
ncbi:MAG: cyclodeaminase/cyclohydrolase family protein [Candidatus Omnitrophica bacterium]|nr:cyclodeaminase/cyclohydrolase family protein [Candidatus Omnitrophota bacterium]